MSKLLAIYDDYRFSASIEYVFHLFLSIYGIDYRIAPLRELEASDFDLSETLVISYGKEKPGLRAQHQIHIYTSDFFGKDYLKSASMPDIPLKRYIGLPIIYSGHGEFDGFVRKSDKLIETNIDIIAASFFMLSRYEEAVLDVKDRYGRFPATASIAYKEKFLDRPIVNEYIELLWNWIDGFDLGFKRKQLWGDKDFAVCVTHDVDEVKRYKFYPPLGAIKRSLVQKDIKKAWAIFIDYLKTKIGFKQDPYHDAFDYIIDLETKYGFTSSFYFMTNGERYSLDDPYSKEIVMKLKNKGFELGIHPGFNAYNNLDVLKSEKERFERTTGVEVAGGRQHYLKWKTPESWRTWEAAGLAYDSTLGFADHEGFRCGICYPFRPFDLIENRVINLWEIPLTVMDGTLDGYRNLSAEEGQDILVKLLKTIERHNGVFVLLWHNSYMCQLFTPEWEKCFEDFYREISSKNAFVSLRWSPNFGQVVKSGFCP